ncbi:MAG TPA: hypothetical protein VFI91_04420 [Longimicrobiaceae bacterium]|nr:hypothetical protein [Longimicrobiaceae bacterium]
MNSRCLLLVLVFLGISAGPQVLSAQSLLANGGLGLPVEPIDARGAALGGVGLALPNNYLSWANPAESGGVPAPGLLATFQFDQFSAQFRGREDDGSTARFPLLIGAFPLGSNWSLTFGYGGILDQNWSIERTDTLLLGSDSVPITDRISSTGGVAAWRLGGAYTLGSNLSVGAGLNAYTGSVERITGRRFGINFTPAESSTSSSYSGLGFIGGIRWTPSEALTLSAAASAGGTLTSETDDSLSIATEYDLPLRLDVGASGRVGSNTLVALGASFAGWSTANDALAAMGGARDSWSFKGGIEWDAIQLGSRPIPVRIGGRIGALPFRWATGGEQGDWVDESAFTGGLGLILAEGAARADFSVERGTRGGDAAGITEDYWRYMLSVSVLGR